MAVTASDDLPFGELLTSVSRVSELLKAKNHRIKELEEKLEDARMHAEQDACAIEALRSEVERLRDNLDDAEQAYQDSINQAIYEERAGDDL